MVLFRIASILDDSPSEVGPAGRIAEAVAIAALSAVVGQYIAMVFEEWKRRREERKVNGDQS